LITRPQQRPPSFFKKRLSGPSQTVLIRAHLGFLRAIWTNVQTSS